MYLFMYLLTYCTYLITDLFTVYSPIHKSQICLFDFDKSHAGNRNVKINPHSKMNQAESLQCQSSIRN